MSVFAYRQTQARPRRWSPGSWARGVATGSSRAERRAGAGELLRARDVEVLGWVCELKEWLAQTRSMPGGRL
jgi:hypothetical protein